jgi:hypothetical protein
MLVAAPRSGLAAEPRVGIYDSRVVAFAHFWSEAVRQERDALIALARDDDERDRAANLSEVIDKFFAFQVRKFEIQQHQVSSVFGKPGDRFLA